MFGVRGLTLTQKPPDQRSPQIVRPRHIDHVSNYGGTQEVFLEGPFGERLDRREVDDGEGDQIERALDLK
jgi:hypothetical protein